MSVAIRSTNLCVDSDTDLRSRRVDCALAVMTGLEKANGRTCGVDSVALFIKAALDNQTVLPDGKILQRLSPAQKGRSSYHVTEAMARTDATLVIDPLSPLINIDSWSR